MTEPVIPGAGRSLRIGVGAAVTGLFVRAALLVMVFGIFRHSWPEYLRTSDGGSFVSLSRVLAGLDRVEHLTLYDTRVFPGWPLLAAPFLAVGLPEQSVLVLALICAALAPWLYLTLTGDTAGTWLLAVFPPAWLLATIHPISEAIYCCLIVAGCLAVQRRHWFLAGLAAGGAVLVRPFGLAWVVAFAVPLFFPRREKKPIAAYVLGGALMAALLAALNLGLYGDLLHQLRVYARPLSELNLHTAPDGSAESPAGHWGWPFVNLIGTPFHYHVPVWKMVYIYGLAAFGFVLAAQAGRRLCRQPALPDWEKAALVGFLGNTLMICCTGPYWGFHSFDRYFIWGLPGALVAARPWWQHCRPLPWALATVSVGVTFLTVWMRFR